MAEKLRSAFGDTYLAEANHPVSFSLSHLRAAKLMQDGETKTINHSDSGLGLIRQVDLDWVYLYAVVWATWRT